MNTTSVAFGPMQCAFIHKQKIKRQKKEMKTRQEPKARSERQKQEVKAREKP